MHFFYNLSILFYRLLVSIASIFNPKARLWIKGRQNIFQTIQSKIQDNNSKIIWFHCASLGEFEQGRPVIEKIKETYSDYKILLTFFSPSGYEIRKNYNKADYIFYLPIDTPSNAKKFIKTIKPSAAFFIKYEFWYNYLSELKKQNIPTFLISGIFRENHYFFKPYASWFRKQLNNFDYFFVQNKTSQNLLNSIGIKNVTISGDTRFDRVFQIAKQVNEIEIVRLFCESKKTIIAGSTWEKDEKIISAFDFSNYKLIIAPHEIGGNHISSIETLFKSKKTIRYSSATIESIQQYEILIIDNIGMLSSLYQYGAIAYIGGGFGAGIHNILEPATFGLPVIFGPNYSKFTEAKELIKLGGAFSINSEIEFKKSIEIISSENKLSEASSISKNYVKQNIGATDSILNSIKL